MRYPTGAFARLLDECLSPEPGYHFAYLDEASKREIRRALLKAVCLPGHQVPFASREMPVARGRGSGGLQVTLATIEPDDVIKVIDQGDDASLNAQAIRELVARTTGVDTTTDARRAALIQTRHRVPEEPLTEGQVLVFQVPIADPLRPVDPRPSVTRRVHAEADYGPAWLYLYEDTSRLGTSSFSHSYPVLVAGRYLMNTTPIPRYDVPRLQHAAHLSLFGAGREATVYAVPPYTSVEPLVFDDRPFVPESCSHPCARCGSMSSYRVPDDSVDIETWVCSDTARCARRARDAAAGAEKPGQP
jgi:alpha-D-ribose 1-methylphosphonate 5-phosphate C-P lyase